MKKSIFLFFAAVLCAMTANAYNQSAKDLYFDNSEAKWNSCYVYIGKGDYTSCYDMKRVTGTQYLWQLPANFNGGNSWNGATGWVVCKEKWWASNGESIDKYVWHGDKNVTKKSTSAWVDTKIYKTNGTGNVTSDGTTKNVYNVTSYTKADYAVTINTVEGGTLTVKDYDNNAVATGASKIHLTVLKFSAAPADGYVLDGVEINDGTNTTTIAAADLATKTHTLTSAVTITPVWRATTSTVTVTATATNGTVTGGGVVEEGTSVTLTATPADGYQFVNWTVGGAEVSTANPYTFTAEEDITVVANFEEIPTHDITVKAFYPASWDAGKAAIHFWGDGVVSPGTPAAMEKDGDWWSYTVTGVPTTSELSVIFINGDNWNGDANQTVDITGVTESTCFEVLQSGSAKGTATKVDCESAPVIPENTYTVVGSSAPLFGEAWTPAKAENDMTLVEGTKYELVKTDVSLTVGEIRYKVAVNHAWDEAYPAENAILNISEAGKYTVTFTFDSNTKAVGATAELTEAAVVLPTVGVKGAWDGWATTTTLTGDNTSATAIVNITTADVYEFGLDVDGNFQASGATINKANNSTVVTTNAGNMKLTANVLGEYTFTWTYETKTLVVTYPAGEEVEIAKKYYIAGTENLTGFEWKENGLQLTKEGTLYKAIFSELPAGIYEFKITDGTWDNTWSYSNLGAAYEEVLQGVDDEGNPNGNIKIVTEEAKNITVIFDATAGKITLEGLTEKVVVISYVLMGVGSDWTTGIALTKNETAEYEEYVLLGQEIAEGDAVKVVTLTNGVATAWCGNVDEFSVAHTSDDNGNIVLAPGKYDFYFKVNDPATADDDIIYIGGEAYPTTATVTVADPIGSMSTYTGVEYDESAETWSKVYNIGEEVTISVNTVGEGWVFAYWTVGEEKIFTEEYTFTVAEDVTVTATYAMAMDVTFDNLVLDAETGIVTAGPDALYGIELTLGIDMVNDHPKGFGLVEGSSILLGGNELELVTGYFTAIDVNAPSAEAVVMAVYEEMLMAFVCSMTAAPAPAYNVVVENATLTDNLEESGFFFMDGTWSDGETIYPVKAEIPGFDATVASATYRVTVTVGGQGDEPWLGFGEGEATVTVNESVVTLTVSVQNEGFKADVTISGTLPKPQVPTALGNIDSSVAPVKMINNGQLVIINNGVQYNAQGAVVK